MASRIRSYVHGELVDHIDFDYNRPFTRAGGNGDIYRGSLILDTCSDGSVHQFCYVALKSMQCGTDDDDNRLANVIDEASVWKDLRHPHVLRFLGLLTDDRGTTYLISPFAPHGSLPQHLVQNPDADRPIFVAQMAAGIAYLHEIGIVHGDVKGANVLVFDGPSARICDFGLAKHADPNPGSTQNQAGSCYWMSPERMFGQTRTRESDVYAFGLTIHEILSGNIPFAGLDSVALVQAVHFREERPSKQPASSSTGVSYELLWALAARCWAQLPGGRPSMGEAFDIIITSAGGLVEVGSEDLPIHSAPPRPSDRNIHKRKRTSSRTEASDIDDAKAAQGDIPPSIADAPRRIGASIPLERSRIDTTSRAGTLCIDDGSITMTEQTVQTNPGAINITTTVQYPSAVLPSKPDTFGREAYIESVVNRLCQTRLSGEGNQPTTPPRLAILGPGGIGKITVALAAVSDHRVKGTYNNRIHWVPCEEATSTDLLVELIARSMCIARRNEGDRKHDVINHLRSTDTHPRLLLLDNFETPWDIPTRQSAVNDILFDIASVSPIAILLTMRSDFPPATRIRWTKPILPPLGALSLSAARELYLDIHEDAEGDDTLDLLLNELACMPLAVRLVATRGRLGEMPSELLALWKDSTLQIKLLHQGDDRITSVMVSVELSINSNLMRSNPEALTLLSVLAELPAGSRRGMIQDIAPTIVDHNGALGTLRQAALVQMHASTHHLQLLSPVRSMVLEKHRATPDARASLHKAYFKLIWKYTSKPGDPIYIEAVKVLGPEAANIETIVLEAMATEPSDTCIKAACDYVAFQFVEEPRGRPIADIVQVARAPGKNPRSLSRGLDLQARTYGKLGRWSDSLAAGEESLAVSKRIGDQSGEARSLLTLTESYRMLWRYEDAVEAGDRALGLYKAIGNQLDEANTYHSLAQTYLKLRRYDDALDAGQKALLIFKRIGEHAGEAASLQILGQTYKLLRLREEAVKVVSEALEIFQRIHMKTEADDCRILLRELGDRSALQLCKYM